MFSTKFLISILRVHAVIIAVSVLLITSVLLLLLWSIIDTELAKKLSYTFSAIGAIFYFSYLFINEELITRNFSKNKIDV